jgi:hypothetical protein
MKTSPGISNLAFALSALMSFDASAQGRDPATFPEQSRIITAQMEARGLADEFKGITTNGEVQEGLFPITASGVNVAPVRDAAARFIATLNDAQRAATLYPVDDIEWRKWGNQSIYHRQGISLKEMNDNQRTLAWNLLDAALSAKGKTLAQDIMHLNYTLGELLNNNFVEYGDDKYWFTFMGEPSESEPWGFQLDGHHLVINFFALGDQVVMTPVFWGSEPAVANAGKYEGTRIMDAEQEKGLAMIRALDSSQQEDAILMTSKTGNNIMTEAFSDNVVLDYAGAEVASFTSEQKAQLIDLIGLYIGNMEDELAEARMKEITEHLDATWFAWIGATEDDSVFYYRIQSPVLLIEFDHEVPVGLGHIYTPGVPYREHIHSVVRTPNGNDYGKDLLRQHYAALPH